MKMMRTAMEKVLKDKLYLTAYQNLIYVYKAMGEDSKAMSTYKAYVKNRDKLLNSFI